MTDRVKTSLLPAGKGHGRAARRVCLKVLSHRRFPFLAAVLAMAMALPSLRSGFQGDDLWFRCAMERPPALERVFEKGGSVSLVANGDPERTEHMMNLGLLPWWTSPDFRLSFWRSVSNVTHWLDFTLWPNSASLMHLQSILWYGVWTFCIALLYRRLIPTVWVAGLAAFLFAIEDAHALPACWIASRNTIIAATFAVVCLLLHDVWRKRAGAVHAPVETQNLASPLAFPHPRHLDRPSYATETQNFASLQPWALLSTLAFALALLSKESAIAICAYLFAYALFLDTSPLRRRLWSVTPYALIVLLWQAAYRILGFGVSDSNLYIDPAGSPLHALKAVFERGPILLFGQLGFPPAETVWLLPPTGRSIFWFVAIGWLALVLYFLIPLLRTDRTARFCFAGMLLATIPASMGMVMNRMLEYVGIGGLALLALLLSTLPAQCQRSAQIPHPWFARAVLAVLVTFHIFFAPIGFFIAHWTFSAGMAKRADALIRVAARPDLAGKTVIFPNPPHASYASYLQIRRALAGQPLPAHVWALAPGYFAHEREPLRCKRLDSYRLQIELQTGIPIQLERGRKQPLRVGDRIPLDGMTVTISEVDAANLPRKVIFAFSEPLDSPFLVWLATTGKELSPWSPPHIGETVSLGGPPADF